MTFAFDLISDLHVETWDSFDWSGQPTAPYCIVAGDIARDRSLVRETLIHLAECYQGGVFYIDGNDEHRHFYDDIGQSYKDLVDSVQSIPNVVYMQDNVVIINGVAILATNGWWTYDFDDTIDKDQTVEWFADYVKTTRQNSEALCAVAYHDATYMINSVKKLQTHKEVKSIVVVSHTVPAPWLVNHDLDLINTWRYNCLGNNHISHLLDEDSENKIRVWCFGHYHKSVDRIHQGVRYVNNCRGRGDSPWCQTAYFPKRIEIEI